MLAALRSATEAEEDDAGGVSCCCSMRAVWQSEYGVGGDGGSSSSSGAAGPGGSLDQPVNRCTDESMHDPTSTSRLSTRSGGRQR